MQLGLSKETVRTYLKSIFSKLDIHRQTELAILVSRLTSQAFGRRRD
jgi:DNA-binding CsgD family transcriptional regulator